jgi:hypothetical protein
MSLASQSSDRRGDFSDPGTGVRAGDGSRSVASKSLGHGIAGMAFYSSDGSMAQDVGGDWRSIRPRQAWSGAIEHRVVAPSGDRPPPLGSQNRVISLPRTTIGAVYLKQSKKRRRHWLLTFDAELLPQPERRATPIKVAEPQIEPSFATGAGFEVESDEQQVEVGVLTRRAHGLNHFPQFIVTQGTAAIGKSTGLLQVNGRIPDHQAGALGPGKEGS